MVYYMKKLNKILSHALNMVLKNLWSYALLSVTVILSFSFLLGFLLMSDSQIYNKYKEVFRVPPTVAEVFSHSFLDGYTGQFKLIALQEVLDRIEAEYFQYYVCYPGAGGGNFDINGDIEIHEQLYLIPGQFQNTYFQRGTEFEYVRFLSGKSQLSSPNEVLIDEFFFNLLGGNDTEQLLRFSLPISTRGGQTIVREFAVVGIVSSTSYDSLSIQTADGKTSYPVHIYASIELLEEIDLERVLRFNINSEYVDEIATLSQEIALGFFSSYRYQQQAMREIRSQVLLKGITVSILFFLLGINLFSSFNNALKERCYEIGVKRAIGAGKLDIVLQFFFEALIVMLANICLSVLVVMNLAVVYKAIQKIFFYNHWIIFINNYSIAFFSASTLVLSIVFSLIFAFQSTEVEIVKHLKGE